MHQIVHFEIPADDLARATEFYRSAFGWKIEAAQGYEGYNLASPGEGAVGGAIMKRPQGVASPVVYLGTDDLDGTLKTITALGAAITTPKSPVPGIGWFAWFRDPEGNTIALFQNDPGAK